MKQSPKFLLIAPPMRNIYSPPLGVSLLKACLQKNGIPSEIFYANIFFAKKYGFASQIYLSEYVGTIMSEYIFSHGLFGRPAKDTEDFIGVLEQDYPWVFEIFKTIMPYQDLRRILDWLVETAGRFLEETVEVILDRSIKYLGLSSNMSENCFCLSLARQVKQVAPEIVTIMGGTNCNGVMGREIFRQFSDIDYLCQGEAEHSLVELVTALKNEGKLIRPIKGVLAREFEDQVDIESEDAIVFDLEDLPDPDFEDYFEQRSVLPVKLKNRKKDREYNALSTRIIPIETSRGCWWAVKHRCSFCGLNPFHKEYRSKSPVSAIGQVRRLAEKYRTRAIFFADTLPDRGFYDSVLPDLAVAPVARLFFETSATLTRNQFEMFARAKVQLIQPGIESLSEKSLKLMEKCTNVPANLQTLKWCSEFGVYPAWNHLYGIPGESPEEVGELEGMIEKITHLVPPKGPLRILLQRYSRYFESPERYGLAPVLVENSFRRIYPFEEESLKNLLYFFESQYFLDWRKTDAWKRLTKSLNNWRRIFWRSHLVCTPGRRGSLLLDTRPCRTKVWRRLSAREAKIYEYCDRNRSLGEICAFLGEERGEEKVQAVLDDFLANKLMICHQERYLALAVNLRRSQLKLYRRFEQENYYDAVSGVPWREIFRIRKQLGISPWRFIGSLRVFFGFKAGTVLTRFRFRLAAGVIRMVGWLGFGE